MNEKRIILHSDMNCFYASVEMMLDPSLRGKAIAVCGSAEERHGIVLAKSELAKKAGVKTGMANWQAKQCCPDLILVPPQYDQYVKYSKMAHEIYYRYTDLVEPFGMDECWLDVSCCGWQFHGDGYAIAEDIRRTIKEELGLTVSIGVSFNKIFAKLGSDMKKPDAVTEITEENFREKVWPLKASEMIFVGRATEAKLHRIGVNTLGELAALPQSTLHSMFGVNGDRLWLYANGLDRSAIAHKDFVSPMKTIGHGITCVANLETDEEAFHVLQELSQDVGRRLRVHGLQARGVEVWIRYADLGGEGFQGRLELSTQLPRELTEAGFELYRKRSRPDDPVRALTIRAIDLEPKREEIQTSLFTDTEAHEKLDRLQVAIEDIRRRYGKKSLTYAGLMTGLKMPDDGRDLVRMPGQMYA